MEVDSPMKDWLRTQGLSYRQLATMMGTSAASISQKLNNETEWQASDLRFFFRKFNLRPSFVLGLTDEEGKKI